MKKLFDYKRRYTASDGEKYIDMCIPAYDVNKIRLMSMKRLNQENTGRIDNFSYYNIGKNFDDIDLVMYANHIFNPFSIQENDILFVPGSGDDYYTQDEPTLVDGRKLSEITSDEKKMTYAQNVEYLGKIGLGLK